ncbi:MAG: hypothetical protein [Olavius algarvensis Gamma 1 endosymbiont]|nr:MAG: hypothetical protein [Olavius algarvensis Gamma 1 endosymbiont]
MVVGNIPVQYAQVYEVLAMKGYVTRSGKSRRAER